MVLAPPAGPSAQGQGTSLVEDVFFMLRVSLHRVVPCRNPHGRAPTFNPPPLLPPPSPSALPPPPQGHWQRRLAVRGCAPVISAVVNTVVDVLRDALLPEIQRNVKISRVCADGPPAPDWGGAAAAGCGLRIGGSQQKFFSRRHAIASWSYILTSALGIFWFLEDFVAGRTSTEPFSQKYQPMPKNVRRRGSMSSLSQTPGSIFENKDGVIVFHSHCP